MNNRIRQVEESNPDKNSNSFPSPPLCDLCALCGSIILPFNHRELKGHKKIHE